MDYSLSDEEFYVLDCAAEEFGAYVLLAWLGTTDHQPARAAAVVERLLDRGLIEVGAGSELDNSPKEELWPPAPRRLFNRRDYASRAQMSKSNEIARCRRQNAAFSSRSVSMTRPIGTAATIVAPALVSARATL